MERRLIGREEIKEVLSEGKVNNSRSRRGNKGEYPYTQKEYSREDQHLRIEVAPQGDGLVVITCIDMDQDWSRNCD